MRNVPPLINSTSCLSLRQARLHIAVDKVLPVRVVKERWRASPLPGREMRKLQEEFSCLLARFRRSPELRKGRSQDSARPGRACRFVAQRLDGILILARGILAKPKHPVIVARWMRIEPRTVARALDAICCPAFLYPEVCKQHPAFGVIGVD